MWPGLMTRLSCMLPLNSFQSPCALPRLLCSLGHPTRLFQGGMSRSNVSFRGCPQLVHAARLRPYERVKSAWTWGQVGAQDHPSCEIVGAVPGIALSLAARAQPWGEQQPRLPPSQEFGGFCFGS